MNQCLAESGEAAASSGSGSKNCSVGEEGFNRLENDELIN